MHDLTDKYVDNAFYLMQRVNPNYALLRNEFQLKKPHYYRQVVLQGGTRSGKTYAICHFLWWLICNVTGLTISIVRKTRPALRATILRDFKDIGISAGLWSDNLFNKTDMEYSMNGNLIEFFSTDQEQKIRGRKRHILVCNEANEIGRDEIQQLMFRTVGFSIFDFNPSCISSYLYDDILTRDDTAFLVTTYKDNPHLPESIIAEIERLKVTDPEAYKIYGQGQRASAQRGRIYTTWEEIDTYPRDLYHWYGLDWGGTDPTAVVCVCYDYNSNTAYLDEVLYRPEIGIKATADVLLRYEQDNYNNVTIGELYADSENKLAIGEIRMYGVSAYPCVKGQGSIVQQIQFMKNLNIKYTRRSVHIKQEIENYKWKERKDTRDFENEPEQNGYDHILDASRYGLFTKLYRDTRVFRTIQEIKGQDYES